MNKKIKWAFTLLFDLVLVAVMCTAAQLLTVARGQSDQFRLGVLLLNMAVAYPFAVLVGMTVPSERFGQWFCQKLRLKPGPAYGLGMSLAISLIFNTVISLVMTAFNVVILAHLGFVPFLFAWLGNYLPMLLVSWVTSFLLERPIRNAVTRFFK